MSRGRWQRQAQLEGHVESRHTESLLGGRKLDAREVVDGEGTGTDQREDAFESMPVVRNFHYTTRREPETNDARDEREIEALVLGVEGDVDEDVAGGLPRRPRDSHPSPQPLLLARRSLLFDPARRSAAVLVVHGDGVSDPLGIMSREAIRPCRLDYRERARRGADDREGLLHFGVPSTP